MGNTSGRKRVLLGAAELAEASLRPSEALAYIPYFAEFSDELLESISSLGTVNEHRPQDLIVQQGQSTDSLTVVLSGTVGLYATRANPAPPQQAGSSEAPAAPVADPFHPSNDVLLTEKLPGECFNDGLLRSGVATLLAPVSVRALGPCRSLVLEADKLKGALSESGQLELIQGLLEHQPSSILKSLPFWEDLSPAHLSALAAVCECRYARKGYDVVRQYDPADGFYVVVRGACRAFMHRGQDSKPTSPAARGGVGTHKPTKGAKQQPHDVELDVLGPGSYFGEFALLQETRRTATVRATEDSVLLFLSNDAFHSFRVVAPELVDNPHFERVIRQRTVQSLAQIELFRTMAADAGGEALALLSPLLGFRHFETDEYVFREGDLADRMFVIVSGSVDILTTEEAPSGDQDPASVAVAAATTSSAGPATPAVAAADVGAAAAAAAATEAVTTRATLPLSAQVTLESLAPGQWFGEVALLTEFAGGSSGSRRMASARASCPTLVVELMRANFARFTELVPSARDRLHEVAGSRTEQLLRRIPFFATGVRETKAWSKFSLLSSLFHLEHLTKGQMVFRRGDVGDTFYIIVRGRVRVSVDDAEIDVLEQSDWVGELALLFDTPRTADVTALCDTLLLGLGRKQFLQFQRVAPELSALVKKRLAARTANELRGLALFANVRENKPWSKLDLLASCMRWEAFEVGTNVVAQGDMGSTFYVVASGCLRAHATTPTGDVVELGELRTGDHFGEVSLLEECERKATVDAVEVSVLLALNRTNFHKVLAVMPELADEIQASAAKRLETLAKHGIGNE